MFIDENQLYKHIKVYYNIESKLHQFKTQATFLQLCVHPNNDLMSYSIGPDYRRLRNRWEVAPDSYSTQDFERQVVEARRLSYLAMLGDIPQTKQL